MHEIGHWLNLYHPWGNNGQCSEDYISETGLQGGPIYPSAECPDTLFSTCDPSERVFVKHYMDYGGNNCLVCFTKNQVLRGLASLNTYRSEMLDNYQPRPTISQFEETKVNPTLSKGRLYVELPPYVGSVLISVYDVSGKAVYTSRVNDRFNEIYLNVKEGIYFLSINHDGNRVFTKKIMISQGSPYGADISKFVNNLDNTIFLVGFFIFLTYMLFLNRKLKYEK